MNKFNISTLLLLVSLFILNNTYAQDDCVLKFNSAEKFYENGKIEQIPELLNNCIESGFNREYKIRALRLLTLVYLFEDNTLKAEKTILRILKLDPEYKVNPAVDPVEFIRLLNSFNTAPIYSFGFVGGPTLTTPHLIEPFSLNNFKDANPTYVASGISFSIGLKGIYHVNTIWDISFEPSFSYVSFKVNENITSTSKVALNETMSYLSFPLLGSYYFYKKNKYSFYGEAGFAYDMFLSGNIKGIVSYNDKEQPDVEPPSISTSEIRKNYNLKMLLGVGTKIDLNRSNFQFNVRYNIGLMNQGNADITNPINAQLISDYQYRDNYFSINNFSFMFSYNREFYIHRKKPNNQTNYDVIR